MFDVMHITVTRQQSVHHLPMARCREYWKMAERNADLFEMLHKQDWPPTANVECDSEGFNLLHSCYLAAVRELDQHITNCPVCRGHES